MNAPDMTIVAWGGPGGRFIYMVKRGTLVGLQLSCTADAVEEGFYKLPKVTDWAQAMELYRAAQQA